MSRLFSDIISHKNCYLFSAPRKVLKPNRYQVSKRAKVKKTCSFLLTVFCYAMINHTNGKCFLTMCSVFKCYANVISNFTIFGTNNLTMPV